ncbi:MAG: hypothetical protein COU63_03770 [Candidatus Pacebacteria bacterium CG10_big_fil_rev_8_21_14_0_10_36_11]|nr:hypothetical protein [Candidatus Pacearchaeota archaeon]OIP73857.1 MAG: hypothetical protein AUK08_04860 [Candidatus Pacebacteria bacterium CG2_30_36_39]PIR64580.1 MAG: hypothetical protein COU63_03770 [Candidatus Pacebacteria bacterium CG10_big_fil_rev_8_21_14_0_10_36_11]PJC43003.1 MAG: hypothetical protein CO040_01530 [Candidatus Pacebacteria bacterium CG_4_9_14_0_2_um_filter_36_8]
MEITQPISPAKKDSKKILNLGQELVKDHTIHLLMVVIYGAFAYFYTNGISGFVLLFLGLAIGLSLIPADEKYLYHWYQDKEDKTSKTFYVTHSVLYFLTLIPTSIFVFTSSGSFLAIGIISGMMLYLITEMYLKLKEPLLFFDRFLQGVKIEPTQKSLKTMLVCSVLFFIFLNFFVIL